MTALSMCFTSHESSEPGSVPPSNAKLLREGDYWTIVFGDLELRVRDSKGMRHLAELLAHPGREIEAVRLAGASAGWRLTPAEARAAGLASGADADVGPILDAPAKRAYRQRVDELRAEIDQADAWGHPERAARALMELDAIIEQLRLATGLGGRDRRCGSAAERARLNITRAIKTAISRIAAHDHALGEHLSSCVHTGRVCVYRPGRSASGAWNVSTRANPRKRAPLFRAFGIGSTGRSGYSKIAYRHSPAEWAIAAATVSSVSGCSSICGAWERG